MLSIRHATGLDDSARQRAATIAQAIALHPLVPHLTGTVIIGAGGTGTLRMDDARPRVLVVLAGPGDSTPLARANAARCDALVIATEWSEFGRLDWARIKSSMATAIVFDGRNLLDPVEMKQLGFLYRSIGR
jgi:hypothetical protein